VKRAKKWLKRIALGAVIFLLAGLVVVFLEVRHSIAKPPPLPKDISVLQLKPESRDGKTMLGKSWRSEREGLPVVCLKGSPLEIGFADGALMQDKMQTLETEFLELLHSYVPNPWVKSFLKDYIFWRDRRLSEFVPEEIRLEIYGTTLGCVDNHPEEGNYYNRLLNYHAAQDVSYMMIDNPFIANHAGCTAFGAWSNATVNAHLITGRNFDWEAAEVFSRDRVVEMFEPDGGIPFISLAWAGMKGVVSGMNRAGVGVTINGAPTKLPDEIGTPVAIVARDVLQHAHNLDEALKIIRDAHVFVSTLWLVGSRADGKFVVVEKTPETTNVREADGDSIVCPNHFETDTLKDLPQNKEYMNGATSVTREQRMKELLQQNDGKIDPGLAVDFLRDRDLPGGVFAGNGNRGSINAFIATHAVVMDLTAGIFYAACPPNGEGKFVAFDVNDFDHELPGLTIPVDDVLTNGVFENFKKAQKVLADGKRALQNSDTNAVLKFATEAETLNPGYYENAVLQGWALLALGKKEDAVKSFELALLRHPAFTDEQKEIDEWLREANAAN
jgi:isopenicillin-N N-acyltransferase-like protein